jgi:3-oxoacyl-[acyl-carrier protein] reductase
MANNHAAIVTGAAHGIGRAVAHHLARQGWQVALADIDGEAVSAAAADIGGAGVACDVGSEADVERLVAVARARLGRIDAIVSNAGIGVFEPMPQTTLADWNPARWPTRRARAGWSRSRTRSP